VISLAIGLTIILHVTKLPIVGLAISGDGQTVGGYLRTGDDVRIPAIWRRDGSITKFSTSPPNKDAMITSLSFDGKTAVGVTYGLEDQASIFYWEEGQSVRLVTSSGFDEWSPIVSGNGEWVFFQTSRYRSSRWSLKTGLKKIDYIERGTMRGSTISGASFTGESWVGRCFVDLKYPLTGSGTGPRFDLRTDMATIWNNVGKPEELGRPDPAIATEAVGCNLDGSIIVGNAIFRNGDQYEPFMWTKSKGIQYLDKRLFKDVEARSVSSDGHMVFGINHFNAGDEEAVLWIDERFASTVLGEALKRGLPKDSGWNFNRVTGASKDGHSVIGMDYRVKDSLPCWLMDW